jgi:hypothetical protein
MHITPEVVGREYEWCFDRSGTVVALINDTRTLLAEQFDVTVDSVDEPTYEEIITTVFEDGDRAVNVAALICMLRALDVEGDYPGFVIDELLGRELAGMIAGDQPLRLLAEATFHVADVRIDSDCAGCDDLDAALAAGVQTRAPGWPWKAGPSPFEIESYSE